MSEKEQEILGWMNAHIPRGKTVPVFEDLLNEYRRETRLSLLEELEQWIEDWEKKRGKEIKKADPKRRSEFDKFASRLKNKLAEYKKEV